MMQHSICIYQLQCNAIHNELLTAWSTRQFMMLIHSLCPAVAVHDGHQPHHQCFDRHKCPRPRLKPVAVHWSVPSESYSQSSVTPTVVTHRQKSSSHTFGRLLHSVNHVLQHIVLILQVLPKLQCRGTNPRRGLRSLHWILQTSQEQGHLELELRDVFSQLCRVCLLPNAFKPRRGDQTHAFDLVLQHQVQWVRYWWKPCPLRLTGIGPSGITGECSEPDDGDSVIRVVARELIRHGCCKALMEPMRRS